MKNIFNSTNANKPRRNVFPMVHERKMSTDFGKLTPVFCQEVVPGDSFKMSTEYLMRFAPLATPVMHMVNVYTHFFFVPNRLVWENFKDFITGGEKGNSNPAFPYITLAEGSKAYFEKHRLPDYLDVPPPPDAVIPNVTRLNALPFRAYLEIYNEYYRDQNLIDKIEYSKGDGSSDAEIDILTTVRTRAFEKDYFTSALPYAQKGGAVHIPIAGEAPVVVDQSSINGIRLESIYGGYLDGTVAQVDGQVQIDGEPQRIDPQDSLKADMTQVTASTVNELREAFQLQKWLERNMRSGSRYIESILAHFGVKSSDARLQRPEYLGGGKSPVVISEVLQTSATDDNTTPQGTMAGHAVSAGKTHYFNKFFEEHGFIIGIMSIIPRTSYSQGLPRIFSKFDRFDYYWPEFAHLGEQEVQNKELFLYDSDNEEIFGYQSRYAEYRYIPSYVNGEFRDTLLNWHLGRTFNNLPTLSKSFVEADPAQNGFERIFAVTDQSAPKIWVQMIHNVTAIRPMPVFADPGLIDH